MDSRSGTGQGVQLLTIRYLICDFCLTDEKNNLGISAEVISCLMDTFIGGAQMRPNQPRKHILAQMFVFVKLYFAARLPDYCVFGFQGARKRQITGSTVPQGRHCRPA